MAERRLPKVKKKKKKKKKTSTHFQNYLFKGFYISLVQLVVHVAISRVQHLVTVRDRVSQRESPKITITPR